MARGVAGAKGMEDCQIDGAAGVSRAEEQKTLLSFFSDTPVNHHRHRQERLHCGKQGTRTSSSPCQPPFINLSPNLTFAWTPHPGRFPRFDCPQRLHETPREALVRRDPERRSSLRGNGAPARAVAVLAFC